MQSTRTETFGDLLRRHRLAAGVSVRAITDPKRVCAVPPSWENLQAGRH